MQLLNLLTLAALASAWVSPSDSTLTDPTAVPVPDALSADDLSSSSPYHVLEARGKGSPLHVWVCGANGGKCWKLRADDKQCKTSTGNGLPVMSLDGHLKCDLWKGKGCKGRANIKGITGKFSTRNHPKARKQGMSNVGSFRCKRY
ncbi:hypothetical protein KC340_g16471 [Hortaea werneckii]|nr:hypothetical protein KC342_g12446 [Hortaea werneckii]KAI7077373.1 hypothetical protein KC339_g13729 [Hortaea werneckii]KAI7226413.1 hypothetical protein KC365_g9414 [Hortaea werneckii]KAI7293450.1 hypothetical protein KC340_g16471 [Hortaea werneckii]KAI7378572.1 hypothetical protein KC328_g13815 [Hortaea werneckii]